MRRGSLLLLPVLLLCAVAARSEDRKVACLGNSITAGYGLTDQWLQNYPMRLDTLLGDGWATTNLGVSGTTMIRTTNNPWWTTSTFPQISALQPDVVVIELGTNDAKAYYWDDSLFRNDYGVLVDTLRSFSSEPQVWATLQPWANNSSWGILDSVLSDSVNPSILQVALENHIGLIDLRAAFDGHKEWMLDDSVHPNNEGAYQLAVTVHGMLSRADLELDWDGTTLTAPEGYGWRWYRGDTLLADSARTLVPMVAGTYRVSVRVEASTLSRQVSLPLAVVPGTTALGVEGPGLLVRVGRDGRIRVEGASSSELRVWDAAGNAIGLQERLKPGLYAWRLGSLRGTLVAP